MMSHKHYETLSNINISKVATGCKNIYEIINSRISRNNSKGPTGLQAMSPVKSSLKASTIYYLFVFDLQDIGYSAINRNQFVIRNDRTNDGSQVSDPIIMPMRRI